MRTGKLHLLVTGIFLFSLVSCSWFKKVTNGSGSGSDRPVTGTTGEALGNTGDAVFDVQFVQNGKEAPIEQGVVALDRAPFTIYLVMPEGDGVYVHAALYYDERFSGNNSFDNLSEVYQKVMAEPSFNKDRELYLSDENYSHWFYDENLDWHRLSDIRVVDNKVIGEKEIENLVFADENRSMPVADVRDDLYLFFFAMNDALSGGFSVKQRNYVKVEWR